MARTTVPLWQTIAENLRQQIESGELPAQSRIPGENTLAEKYQVSRVTVRRAIEWLTTRRLVERRPGQGTFVVKIEPLVTTLSADSKRAKGLSGGGEGRAVFEEAAVRGIQDKVTADPRLTVELKFAEGIVASLLEVQEGTGVVVRQVKRYFASTPWSLERSYYPMKYLEQGAVDLRLKRDIEDGVIAYLREKLGIKQVGLRDQIVVRPPNDDEAKFFRLPDNGTAPVVVIFRTGYAEAPENPVPFRVTITVYPADRNQFVINSGKVGKVIAEPIDFLESSAYDSLI
jgi:GntR family transcriptional regulator